MTPEPQTTEASADDFMEVTEAEMTIVNEFTAVKVRKVHTRNGQRLEVSSLRFDHRIRLDALALEGLSWQTSEVISGFLEQPFGPEDDH